MLSLDSLDQCMNRKKAAEFVIMIGSYGPNIYKNELDENQMDQFKEDIVEFFEELFKGEEE